MLFINIIYLTLCIRDMNDHLKIGIMSGRLSLPINNKIQSFPKDSWKSEFMLAKQCGFETIEWIVDHTNNPIFTNEGIREIKTLSHTNDIQINTLLADYFMEHLLFNISMTEKEKNFSLLKKIIEQCYKLEISVVEIPLVDTSSLKKNKNKLDFIRNLSKIIEFATSYNVKITLETDLSPIDFKSLLQNLGKDIGANYDTGNSASLGYDVIQELELLKTWLTNIHLKDRLLGGDTVPFGMGCTNFDLFFQKLSKINYTGELIIQGARQEKISPLSTCKSYLDFIKIYANKHLIPIRNS